MTDNEQQIDNAVTAWLQARDGTGDPERGAELVLALDEDSRREAFRRLGYSTRAHLELFGL